VLAAALALGLAGATWLLLRNGRPDALDENLVAVAPFDILVPTLDLWREGLVDVLSRDLDGAGPLRAVAPTIVVRRWNGRADAPSAAALGRATGARLALFGQVLGSGGDSVRVNATLYDVALGRPLGEFQVRDLSDRIDRVADSLTVALLRELGRTRPIGAVRLASLGSASLPALKAFLRGEQFYRRTAWDSAIAYYQRAISDDTAFAPALRRIGLVLGWQRSGHDSLSKAYHLRAGWFNRGLAPRESLLIAADSLSASLYAKPVGLSHWSQMRRLFATLGEATRRYPDDPEVWYALGDARFHFGIGPSVGVDERQVLAAFDRAIALDSAFGPSYIHPVAIALALDGPAASERYWRPYLALAPQDADAQGIRAMAQLLGAEGDARRRRRLLDTTSLDALHHAWAAVYAWPDSDETALTVVRALLARAAPADTADARHMLAHQLLYRGHLREALREAPAHARSLVAEAALSGAAPADSVSRLFARWFRRDSVITGELARWWAGTRDSATLVAAIALADGMARGELALRPFAAPPDAEGRQMGRYHAQALRGYLDLARGDTARALTRFSALPDTVCHTCTLHRLTTAQLLAARGRHAEAAAILDRQRVRIHTSLQGGLWALERARVREQLGDPAGARDDYRFVADVWRHADPELLALVAEAKAGLQRLGAEPRP
jgi:serine/threonine-protein kinase